MIFQLQCYYYFVEERIGSLHHYIITTFSAGSGIEPQKVKISVRVEPIGAAP